MVRWISVPWIVSVVACTTAACTSGPLDVDIVAVDLVGDVIIGPSQQAVLEVTAANRTNQRVVWGMGSSSCQLGLVVLVAGRERNVDFRACTDDLVEHALDPGQARTESFTWDGQIASDGVLSLLPPGRYRVFGIAGDRGASAPLEVTIVDG